MSPDCRASFKSIDRLIDFRFFINLGIRTLANSIADSYGHPGQRAMLFPTRSTAMRCADFLERMHPTVANTTSEPSNRGGGTKILDLVLCGLRGAIQAVPTAAPALSAVLFPDSMFSTAAKFWQHAGEGISSRRAEFFQLAFTEGRLQPRTDVPNGMNDSNMTSKGPRRYQRLAKDSSETSCPGQASILSAGPRKDGLDFVQFVEERFGRNLNVSQAQSAKLAIRRRIAGKLKANLELSEALAGVENAETERSERGVSENDVFLFPTGMSSIFNTHRMLMKARSPSKSIMFG